MDAYEGERRGDKWYGSVALTTAVVLVGLAIGTVTGLRLAESATAHGSAAVGSIAPPAQDHATRSQSVQGIDHSGMETKGADASDEPGMSIAAYGN